MKNPDLGLRYGHKTICGKEQAICGKNSALEVCSPGSATFSLRPCKYGLAASHCGIFGFHPIAQIDDGLWKRGNRRSKHGCALRFRCGCKAHNWQKWPERPRHAQGDTARLISSFASLKVRTGTTARWLYAARRQVNFRSLGDFGSFGRWFCIEKTPGGWSRPPSFIPHVRVVATRRRYDAGRLRPRPSALLSHLACVIRPSFSPLAHFSL
jgi:hypothetical protein